MFQEASDFQPGAELATDVCIVGAGAAGITLALELAGTGLDVVVLESGGLDFETSMQDMNRGQVSGLPYYDLETTRLRYLGGTTNHWSGWCRPLDAIDFERRDYIPESGWPIDAATIAPYYPAACRYCELDDQDFRLEAYQSELPDGLKATRPTERLEGKLWKRSPPTRFGERYRDALRNAANVRVLLHATAVEIETSEDGGEATAVRALGRGDRALRVSARRIVLCAGGIESPRLLLASTERAPGGVGNRHDQVGRYFMLHPQLEIGELLIGRDQSPMLLPQPENRRQMIRAGFTLSPAAQREHGLANHAILFNRGPFDDNEGLKFRLKALKARLLDEDIAYPLRSILGDLGAMGTGGEPVAETRWVRVQLRMDHLPNPDSRLLLAEDRDQLGVKRADLRWQSTGEDFDGVRRTASLFGAALAELGLGRLRLAPWLTDGAGQWPDEAEWDYHHLGATRMHADPKRGVVDAQCAVHGTPNLYVVSSSVFTTAGFANPTLTIIALAIRLAERLRQEQTS